MGQICFCHARPEPVFWRRNLSKIPSMKSIRIAIGAGLILGGAACGVYAAVGRVSLGIAQIRSGQVVPGLVNLLLWSELFGILAALAFIVPGVWVLRTVGIKPNGSFPPESQVP